jgi:hypothetical protein
VDYARLIVPDFHAHESVAEGQITHQGVGAVRYAPGDFVICPRNAPLVSAALGAITDRVPAFVRGRSFSDSLHSIYRKVGDIPTIAGFRRGVQRWLSERLLSLADEEGREDRVEKVSDQAAALLAVADACSCPSEIPEVLRTLCNDDEDRSAAVCFSSVHRAKGSEARRVIYLQSGKGGPRKREPTADEHQQNLNLEYVARTRSLEELVLVSPIS